MAYPPTDILIEAQATTIGFDPYAELNSLHFVVIIITNFNILRNELLLLRSVT